MNFIGDWLAAHPLVTVLTISLTSYVGGWAAGYNARKKEGR